MHTQINSNDENRRRFLAKCVAGGTGIAAAAVAQDVSASSFPRTSKESHESMGRRPKIVFLDVNETLLDLAPLKKSVGAALDGKSELLPLWFTTMLQYSLVATVADRYEHFTVIGAAALKMVASNHDIKLTTEQADKAIEPIRSLSPHADVEPAMKSLKEAGFKLVTLTNSSSQGVEQQMKNSGLDQYLTDRLSVEQVGIYKPHSHVYRWAARKMDQEVSDCMLVAAHGWDIAGALWAGMRGAFLARSGAQLFPLAPKPEINQPTFKQAAELIIGMPS